MKKPAAPRKKTNGDGPPKGVKFTPPPPFRPSDFEIRI
jgi:hypothetical protein